MMKENIAPVTLTAKQICQALGGLCYSTFRQLRKKGYFTPIPAIRRNRIYPRTQLDKFIAEANKESK